MSRAWCLNHRTTREVIAFRFNSLVFLGVKAPCGGGGGAPLETLVWVSEVKLRVLDVMLK